MINIANQSTGRIGFTKAGRVLLATVLLGAVALPFFAPLQTVRANNDRREDSGQADPEALVGTWVVQVSLDPATVPPGAALNFTRLDTYGAGGTLIASNNGPGGGGPAGQGNWIATGHRQFAATDLRLGFDTAHLFTGISKIRTSISLDRGGNEFTATYQTDIFLPNGTQLGLHPAGTGHATRVPIEPVN